MIKVLNTGDPAACLLRINSGDAESDLLRSFLSDRSAVHGCPLIKTGFNALCRNPMYLGLVLFVLGLGIFISGMYGFIGAFLLFLELDRVQIPAEERELLGIFGAEYANYRKSVGKWF